MELRAIKFSALVGDRGAGLKAAIDQARDEAAAASNQSEARRAYAQLYGPEIDAIREREARTADRRAMRGLSLAPLASVADKSPRSDGD